MLRHDQAIEQIVYDCHKRILFFNNGSFDFRRNSNEHNSKRRVLWLLLGTHSSSFFTLPIFLGWSDIVEMLISNTWDIFLTFWCRFFTEIVFRPPSSIVDRHPQSSYPYNRNSVSCPKLSDHKWILYEILCWYWQLFERHYEQWWTRAKISERVTSFFVFMISGQ